MNSTYLSYEAKRGESYLNFRGVLKRLLENDGAKEAEVTMLANEENEEVFFEIAKEIKEEHVREVFRAAVIDEYTYRNLKNKELSRGQMLSRTRYQIQMLPGVPLTEGIVRYYVKHRDAKGIQDRLQRLHTCGEVYSEEGYRNLFDSITRDSADQELDVKSKAVDDLKKYNRCRLVLEVLQFLELHPLQLGERVIDDIVKEDLCAFIGMKWAEWVAAFNPRTKGNQVPGALRILQFFNSKLESVFGLSIALKNKRKKIYEIKSTLPFRWNEEVRKVQIDPEMIEETEDEPATEVPEQPEITPEFNEVLELDELDPVGEF
jgi:hypothetical protein